MALGDTFDVTRLEADRTDDPPTAQRRANGVLIAAAALAALTAVVHVIGGGASVWGPISDSTLADEPRLVSMAVWHMASVALALSAAALGLGALPRHAQQSRYLVTFISTMWIGFGLCFIGTAVTQPGGGAFGTLPQPVLLLPVGLLGLLGARSMP